MGRARKLMTPDHPLPIHALATAGLIVVLTAAGCGAFRKPLRLAVCVRDAQTHAPIAGANVRATPLHLFLPVYPHLILDLDPEDAQTGVTGEDGCVVVTTVKDKPLRVHVHAAGYAPVTLDVPRRLTGEPWLRSDDAARPDGMRSMQVRIARSEARRSKTQLPAMPVETP